MKKIIILFILLQNCLVFSQRQQGQGSVKMIKYNAKNAANIFYYNIDKIPKKIKIKKKDVEKVTKRALRVYNDKIRVITFLNTQNLDELDLIVNTMGKEARTNPDLGRKIRKQIESVILPIRDSIKKNEEILNSTLKPVFSKKQFKKWMKYQAKKKKDLRPKRPKSNNNGQMPRSRNRRRY